MRAFEPRLSRRRFLQLLGGAAALAAAPAPGRSAPCACLDYDDGSLEIPAGATPDASRVIVVGAGFAGLAAANALRNAGVEVVVLEARARLGGRAWTADVAGVPVDLGASWIHTPVGNPMARLAQHRTNALPGFTSKYGVYRLVHFEMFGEIERAIAREKQLKNWHRQWKINLINAENPEWRDLAVGLGFEPVRPRQRRNGS